MKKLQSSIGCLVLLVSVAAAFGCFITNCPPGGKRSGPPPSSHLAPTPTRQCEPCGPDGGGGRCFGPNICCLPEFGCLVGTPETFSCSSESRFTTPCRNVGAPCTGLGNNVKGQCAGEGICCSSETCTLDENCRESGSSPMFTGGGEFPEFRLSIPEDDPPRVMSRPPFPPRVGVLANRLNARFFEQLLNHHHQNLQEPRPAPPPGEVKREQHHQ